MNRVLHIWDVGGSSCVSLKAIRHYGYEGDVVMRKLHDPLGFVEYYNGLYLDNDKFIRESLNMVSNYDIIHLNGLVDYVGLFKKRHPNKKIILSYYGSDLTVNPDSESIKKAESFADAITVSTKDLLQFEKEHKYNYIPNAIDDELYTRQESGSGAFTFTMSYLDNKSTIDFIKKNYNGDFDIIDREKNLIPFYEMPSLFSKYSTYIDVKILKYGYFGKAYSKTALEALSCGLNVFNFNQEIISKLPNENTMKAHAEKLINLYNE